MLNITKGVYQCQSNSCQSTVKDAEPYGSAFRMCNGVKDQIHGMFVRKRGPNVEGKERDKNNAYKFSLRDMKTKENTIGDEFGAIVTPVQLGVGSYTTLTSSSTALATMPFASDDGFSVYWNTSKVQLGDVLAVPEFYLNGASFKAYIGKSGDLMFGNLGNKPFEDDSFFFQQFVKGGVKFNLFVGHIESGEEYKKEEARMKTLNDMFEIAKRLENPIFVLDSNSSEYYRQEYKGKPTIVEVIKNNSFVDIASSVQGLECFKMRDGKGNQDEKLGNLMFDKIDGVYVDKLWSNCSVAKVGKTYDAEKTAIIQALRTNPLLRTRLQDWVLNFNNEKDKADGWTGKAENILRPVQDNTLRKLFTPFNISNADYF